jgi:hypothetical protein
VYHKIEGGGDPLQTENPGEKKIAVEPIVDAQANRNKSPLGWENADPFKLRICEKRQFDQLLTLRTIEINLHWVGKKETVQTESRGERNCSLTNW